MSSDHVTQLSIANRLCVRDRDDELSTENRHVIASIRSDGKSYFGFSSIHIRAIERATSLLISLL